MPQIVFENVSKLYGEDIVLENISLEIEKGEFVFLTGRSGAGKTTLLRLITKQEDASSGEVTVDGQRLKLMQKKELPYYRRKLGIMSTDIGLLRDRNVYENIVLAVCAAEKNDFHVRKRVMRVLGIVGMAERAGSYPDGLSGGETARVLLARAISTDPQIIIADEPTANLDADAAWDLMQIFQEINYQGATVIIASHARELVTIMKQRCITLVAGVIVSDKKKSIYNDKAQDIWAERKILEERKNKKC